ncbi:dysferlin-like, partial [Sphaerodactylus townsendi]|uniref:dysferlin-like n=1 Tax=Sphaerodactylus townsendi TaxID=933632 RepID=UPI0020264A58
EANLELVHHALKAKCSAIDLDTLVAHLIDEVIVDCSQPLVDVTQKSASTHLDGYLYRFRTTNLRQIAQAALRLKQEDSDLQMVLDQAEDWLSRLKSMAEEAACYQPTQREEKEPHKWERSPRVCCLGNTRGLCPRLLSPASRCKAPLYGQGTSSVEKAQTQA